MPDTTGAAAGGRYKIGEICRLADVQPYVLRYWENEFPVLATDRSLPGPRTYSERELKVIQRIKTLLYVEGFTIAGAKKRLEAEMKSGFAGDEATAEPAAAAAEDDGPGTAPIVPPPLPKDAAPAGEPKARRTRTRPVPVAAESAPEPLEILDEEVTPAAASGSDAAAPEVRTGVVKPPDMRLQRVVTELREILEILSREP